MKNSIRIAGAYVGLIVGAGFASGQEILQFFTSFGWAGTSALPSQPLSLPYELGMVDYPLGLSPAGCLP